LDKFDHSTLRMMGTNLDGNKLSLHLNLAQTTGAINLIGFIQHDITIFLNRSGAFERII
jgi:hypothetical protein